ncbi:MAG TPA: NAD(P)-dependent oxidoreductase [Gaiellaceae bacterium]|jgi:nucleoside-diphosphate-sugar epimerase|nr:NAD(P)-dependent oxidoreductase [Gaiellaceae bacterium]
MKVLLTGHHGYIGSVTGEVLEASGHSVTGLDTYFYRGCDLEGDGSLPPARELDVRDIGPADFEGYDAVVHLAALSNDPIGALRPELTLQINYEASVAVATAARAAGVSRFVFASSCSMYGGGSGDVPVDETSPQQPLTAYAESKVYTENAVRELADDSFSPIFMRNSTAYGVSDRLRLDVVLNNLAAWAHTTGRIKILSDGTPWRPIVHIRDIAGATAALLEAPRDLVHAEAFNIGSDTENYRVSDLASIVEEETENCVVEYAGSGDPDPRSYRVDFGKFARAFPDFTYEWTARKGARELLDAFARVNLTLEEFESHRFIRLKQLMRLRESGSLDADLRWRIAA